MLDVDFEKVDLEYKENVLKLRKMVYMFGTALQDGWMKKTYALEGRMFKKMTCELINFIDSITEKYPNYNYSFYNDYFYSNELIEKMALETKDSDDEQSIITLSNEESLEFNAYLKNNDSSFSFFKNFDKLPLSIQMDILFKAKKEDQQSMLPYFKMVICNTYFSDKELDRILSCSRYSWLEKGLIVSYVLEEYNKKGDLCKSAISFYNDNTTVIKEELVSSVSSLEYGDLESILKTNLISFDVNCPNIFKDTLSIELDDSSLELSKAMLFFKYQNGYSKGDENEVFLIRLNKLRNGFYTPNEMKENLESFYNELSRFYKDQNVVDFTFENMNCVMDITAVLQSNSIFPWHKEISNSLIDEIVYSFLEKENCTDDSYAVLSKLLEKNKTRNFKQIQTENKLDSQREAREQFVKVLQKVNCKALTTPIGEKYSSNK